MFDLTFHEIVAKLYKFISNNSRYIEIVMNTRRTKENLRQDILDVNMYSEYIYKHIKYFYPNSGYFVNK
jgi:hypothetical protein